MITKIKRKDIGKLLDDNIGDCTEYYVIDQAADKIRAIYVLFGWSHMLKDMRETDDTLYMLLGNCAESLLKNPKQKDSTHSTAGISVSLFESDEIDTMQIEVSFNIVN